jgi:hypothetical protein
MSERVTTDEEGDRTPMMKIGDATDGRPPEKTRRRLLTRGKRWFLLSANRWFVTGVLFVGMFLAVALVGMYGPVSVQSYLTVGPSPGSMLIELLKTIVSVVVIVLSINQLVLSPGLGPVGDQRTRFEDSMDLRKRVEKQTGERVSPSSPAAFLHAIVASLVEQAHQVRDVAEQSGNDAFAAEADEFVTEVVDEAAVVRNQLRDDRFGRFEVVPNSLRFAISEKARDLRLLQEKYESELTDDEVETLETMGELLELFTVSREYLKTVYIRAEYINLSEALLYVGVPALVFTYCAVLIYTPSAFPGATFGVEHLLLFVSLAVAVSLTPFALLVTYIFRLAAMSRSTLFIGPFAARADD